MAEAVTARAPLFVYGSLKRGFVHHRELAGADFLRVARTVAGYALALYRGYPGLIAHGSAAVEGELFAVDRELFERLDAFEEVPSRYRREQVLLDCGTRAFAYLVAEAGDHALVPGGVWRER